MIRKETKEMKKPMKAVEYLGKENKEFIIKHQPSTSPKRKFGCKPGDVFLFEEQIDKKTAMFLLKTFHSDFRLINKEITERDICKIKIQAAIDKYGYDMVFDCVNEYNQVDKSKKPGRPKKS